MRHIVVLAQDDTGCHSHKLRQYNKYVRGPLTERMQHITTHLPTQGFRDNHCRVVRYLWSDSNGLVLPDGEVEDPVSEQEDQDWTMNG